MIARVILEPQDLDVIAAEIALQDDDTTCIDVNIDGYSFTVSYSKETTVSRECDYFNGTGAYNVSCSYLSINGIQADDDAFTVVYDGNLLHRKTIDLINC